MPYVKLRRQLYGCILLLLSIKHCVDISSFSGPVVCTIVEVYKNALNCIGIEKAIYSSSGRFGGVFLFPWSLIFI